MSKEPLLALHEITKTYGGVHALTEVSLQVHRGEVHAVVGENGAGKSTMMKIIAGAVSPTSGRMEYEGAEVSFRGPRDASQVGIAIVYQEPAYFPEMSVLENLYLGEELRTSIGALDWRRMTEGAAEALRAIGLPEQLLSRSMVELSIGTQQLVLIARSIHRNCKLLILDEPTAILSLAETEILFKAVRRLRERGVSVLYISHRIAEIFEIADRISVLRDGRLAAAYPIDNVSADEVVTAMTGRQILLDEYRPRDFADRPPLVEVRDLCRAGNYRNVSFALRPGEILGLYGLVGAGRSEVARAIYGELLPDSGEILVDGERVSFTTPQHAIARGVLYVAEDRRRQGLFPIRSTSDNLSAGVLGQLSTLLGWIAPARERSLALELMRQLNIKASSPMAPVSSLSGGNQQKVVLGRGLSHEPRILMLDEPTHGIDVGTKSEIHRLVNDLAERGLAILLISSDLPEVLALADNTLVLHEGHVVDSLTRSEMTEERILRSALGLEKGLAVPPLQERLR
jgi:ABC-type sugar transport system ATPase subunit